ncbi:unnamed protein product [Protopolystoma xenopodis]|uniref:Uncharacterized protein n=1 Tax=Protopolystoma xenopodis TaxID=117903 RepID=A0A448WYY4_9PLAT|nr:unnamed protein product [Protopolystoma xenopodis]
MKEGFSTFGSAWKPISFSDRDHFFYSPQLLSPLLVMITLNFKLLQGSNSSILCSLNIVVMSPSLLQLTVDHVHSLLSLLYYRIQYFAAATAFFTPTRPRTGPSQGLRMRRINSGMLLIVMATVLQMTDTKTRPNRQHFSYRPTRKEGLITFGLPPQVETLFLFHSDSFCSPRL